VWQKDRGTKPLCVALWTQSSPPHSIATKACKNDICLVQFSSVSIVTNIWKQHTWKRTTKLFFSCHKLVLIPHGCSSAMTLFGLSCCSYSSLNGILLKQILAKMFGIDAQFH
jgi:hypothetical protein